MGNDYGQAFGLGDCMNLSIAVVGDSRIGWWFRVDPVRRRANQNGGCSLLLNYESDSGTPEDIHASA